MDTSTTLDEEGGCFGFIFLLFVGWFVVFWLLLVGGGGGGGGKERGVEGEGVKVSGRALDILAHGTFGEVDWKRQTAGSVRNVTQGASGW